MSENIVECQTCHWTQHFIDSYQKDITDIKLRNMSKNKIVSLLHQYADMIDDIKWMTENEFIRSNKTCPECGHSCILVKSD